MAVAQRRGILQASDDEVAAFKARAAEVATMRRRAVRVIDPTPTRLGQRLDSLIVRTPALDLVDAEMLKVRDAVDVMLRRQARFAELAGRGVNLDTAVEQAAAETPQTGNTRLLLSMPPQEGKTTAVSRYGLLWILRQFPGLRVVIVSFDGVNATRMSRVMREDIQLHDGTGENTDLGLRLARDQAAASRWRLQDGSDVYAIGVTGGLTGRPVDLLIIDDPVKDDSAATSDIQSSRAWTWWMGVGRPRLAPNAPVIVVGTRWHELDLIGRLQAKQAEDEKAGAVAYDRWRTLAIPAQADPTADRPDPLGREAGVWMASARGRTRDEWEATKVATSSRQWLALFQCQPSPDEGNIWLAGWWREYDRPMWAQQPDGSFKVPGVDRLIWSWDMSFKDSENADYVCGQLWAKKGAESFVIYSVWARLNFSDTQTAVIRGHTLFPAASPTLVEDTANGPAIIASLAKVVPGIVPVKAPTTSKVARAEAVSPFLRAGNVWLPSIDVAVAQEQLRWDPGALVIEAKSFPHGAHDDQVDAASQALAELYLGAGGPMRIQRAKGMLPSTKPPTDEPSARRLPPRQRALHRRATGGTR